MLNLHLMIKNLLAAIFWTHLSGQKDVFNQKKCVEWITFVLFISQSTQQQVCFFARMCVNLHVVLYKISPQSVISSFHLLFISCISVDGQICSILEHFVHQLGMSMIYGYFLQPILLLLFLFFILFPSKTKIRLAQWWPGNPKADKLPSFTLSLLHCGW